MLKSKNILRIVIVTTLIFTFAGTAYLGYQAFLEKKWDTITGALAVVAALITIASSLSLNWRLEDEKEPYLHIFFDSKSNRTATSLVVRNDGGSPAFNVRLQWIVALQDFNGKIVQFNADPEGFDILNLPPGTKITRFIGYTQEMLKGLGDASAPIYTGTLYYSTSPSKKSRLKQEFRISMEPIRKGLMSTDDEAEFYFNNKILAEKVKTMGTTMASIDETLKKLINENARDANPNEIL